MIPQSHKSESLERSTLNLLNIYANRHNNAPITHNIIPKGTILSMVIPLSGIIIGMYCNNISFIILFYLLSKYPFSAHQQSIS